jgi:hypothetical protein
MNEGVPISHPSSEDIAALIDGHLEGGRRAEVIAHLADCWECYDVFSATGRSVLGGGAAEAEGASVAWSSRQGKLLRPDDGRWRRRSLLVLPAIAAAALFVAVLLPRGAAVPPIGELSAQLRDPATLAPRVKAGWQEHGWSSDRGASVRLDADEEVAFRLGVRVTELDVALAADAQELAVALSSEIARLAQGTPDAHSLLLLYGGDAGIGGQLAARRRPSELLPLNRLADERLTKQSPAGGDDSHTMWYQLGKWSRATHLAATSGDVGYLSRHAHRRFLASFMEDEAPEELDTLLRRLDTLLASDQEPHLPEIEQSLEALIAIAGGGSTAGGSPPPP